MIVFILFVKLLMIKFSIQHVTAFVINLCSAILKICLPYGRQNISNGFQKRIHTSDCFGLTCLNNGTLEDFNCTCECTEQFSGLYCEYELERSNWPPGPYAIPTPIDGCPEYNSEGWTEGYVNITTRVPLGIWITQNDFSKTSKQNTEINGAIMVNIAEDRLHIPYTLGPYGRYTFQFNFCYKIKNHRKNNMSAWPLGKYAIYGTENGCPAGFDNDSITVTLPDVMTLSMDGDLPYMDIRYDNSQVKITFNNCQRAKEASTHITTFWANTPFILLQGKADTCTVFDGFHATSEYLHAAQINKTDNMDDFAGFFLKMCYYTPDDYIKELIDSQELDDALSSCQLLSSVRVFARPFYYDLVYMKHKDYFTLAFSEKYNLNPTLEALLAMHVNIGKGQNSDDVPWLLFDLKQTTTIHSVFIHLDSGFDSVGAGDECITCSWKFNYPELFVSKDKWSFLNNGATLGRTVVYRSYLKQMHVFLKRMEGRYLSIVAIKYKTDNLALSFFLNIKQFNIFPTCGDDISEFLMVCHRELGMLDNIIKDSQLSASSWQHENPPALARQYLMGWCADPDDVDPFFQVNLIATTAVNGITVINGYKNVVYEHQGEFARKIVPLGCKSLRLKYGTNLNVLNDYYSVFELDLSTPYDRPHTFVFRKPFLARFIRIYPQALPNTTNICLRLELLGCAKSVISSDQCDLSFGRTVDNTWGITWPACFDRCMIQPYECSTLLYFLNLNDSVCVLNAPNTPSIENWNTSGFKYTCTEGRHYKPSVSRFTDSGSLAGIHKDNIFSIRKQGVIKSVGFPFYYLTDQLYVWNITLSNRFIRLIFSNISLHAYKDVTDYGDCDSRLRDDVIEIRHGVNDGDNHGGRELLHNGMLHWLDYRRNGQTPTVAAKYRTLNILLRTCHRNLEKTETGIGFRVIVKEKDVANCFNAEKHVKCGFLKMSFGSPSYFGLIQARHLYTWEIIINEFSTILLRIIDFDANCQQEASLKLRDVDLLNNDQLYCNSNRPVGPIKSKYNYLKIMYRTTVGEYQNYDGFYAEYEVQHSNRAKIELSYDREKAYPTESLPIDYGYVCLNDTRKCYYILVSSGRSWEDASDYCWTRWKLNLVTIHSALELQSIQEALVEFSIQYTGFSDFKSSIDPTLDPLWKSYIGLRTDTNGIVKQQGIWEDGTPLTFTAWGSKQPAKEQRNKCTRMGFDLLNEAHTWETINCDILLTASFFMCQTSTRQILQNSRNEIKSVQRHSGEADNLFKCTSGTRISSLSVCDGFPDCFDWSDELKCIDDQDFEEMFRCNDGRNIHISYVCNFSPDCYDGSDEICEFPACRSSEFQCYNMQCILNYTRCDAVLDCLDGSDEKDCGRCNRNVAFQCDDFTCIPLSLVCDNHVDCIGKTDEQGCEQKPMTSCSAVWEAGYRHNGIYNLEDGRAECQFITRVDADNVIVLLTYIHDMYIDYTFKDSSHRLTFHSNLLDRLKLDNVQCTQKIIKTCYPYLLTLAEHDGIHEDVCACQMRTLNQSTNKMNSFQPCPDSNVMEAYINHTEITPIQEGVRYILKPVICWSEIKIVTKTIPCEASQLLIPENRRCLYSTDVMGRIDGCRSRSHLQDCDEFQCPSTYVKCWRSYCVAQKHICDGVKECLFGEDEQNCWCQVNKTNAVTLIYDIGVDVNVREATFTLAKQLQWSSAIVRVLQIKLTDPSTNVLANASKELLVTDTIIDSLGDHRNRYLSDQYTLRSKDLENHIRNNLTNSSLSEYIILIQDSMSVIHLDQFFELKAFSTLYSVDFNESISKKSETINESSITKIKIRRFGDNVVIDPFLFKDVCNEPKNSTCNSMYKCASSHICIHHSQVCDVERDCPAGDDEFACRFTCPRKCICKGLAIDCRKVEFKNKGFVTISSEARAVDLSHTSDFKIESLEIEIPYLFRLNLSNSGLRLVNTNTFSKLHNIQVLDISFNQLKIILTDTFKNLKTLMTLNISGNYLLNTIQAGAFNGLTKIRDISVTRTKLTTVLNRTFAGLHLLKLDLSSNKITTIEDMAFSDLEVTTIDISRNLITNFNKDMFTGVRKLQVIHSSAYKFCCIRPSTVRELDCHPYQDEFSSCDDLIKNNILQAFLWVIGICALLGNVLSLAYRFTKDLPLLKLGYGIFVTNLSIADCMMGIYLIIIGIADTVYRDRYIWNDDHWRNSIWCKIAGVLSTLSSEASVLFICLITLDRLLVIKYPFGQIRIRTRSAIFISIVSWLVGIFIAVIPLIHTDYFQNQFYSKSGVCLALPLTRDRPPGWQYAVAVFIGFNLVTFLLISISQWMIYKEINRSQINANSRSKSRKNDLRIAKKLLFVVTTDFMCWFPVGCMGLMALNGTVISGDVYAYTAVLVLPINSAINPFLYTLSAIMSARNFVPSFDEQNRIREYKYTEYGNCIMTIWNNRVLRPPTTAIDVKTMSLEQYIQDNQVTPRDILAITVQLTCGIDMLHGCNLVFKELNINNVTAVTDIDRQVFDYVQLQLMPRVSLNTIEKQDDVYCLGVIIRELLNTTNRKQY